jgi:hypothetical protein
MKSTISATAATGVRATPSTWSVAVAEFWRKSIPTSKQNLLTPSAYFSF